MHPTSPVSYTHLDVYKRQTVTIAQAPLEAVNIVDYDKKSNGAIDYMSLVDEVKNHLQSIEWQHFCYKWYYGCLLYTSDEDFH